VFDRIKSYFQGFPASTDDVREFKLGGLPEDDCAYIRLRCVDLPGHTELYIKIGRPGGA